MRTTVLAALLAVSLAAKAGAEEPPKPNPPRSLEGHTDAVNDVAFSPDGALVASCSADKTIRLWDPTSGESKKTLSGHTKACRRIAWSSDGKLLASVSDDLTLRVWDVATGKSRKPADVRNENDKVQLNGESHTARLLVNDVAFSGDGKRVVVVATMENGNAEPNIRVFDVATGKLKGGVWANSVLQVLGTTPDGKLIAGGVPGEGPNLYWVDAEAITKSVAHRGGEPAQALAFSPDGKQFVIGSLASRVKIFSTDDADGTELKWKKYDGDNLKDVRGVAWSPKGDRIAAVGDAGFVLFFSPDPNKDKWWTKHGHKGPVYAASFSPDGKTLATGGDDKTVKLFEVP